MYRYDEFDTRLVQERVEQFRRQTGRRLNGEMDEDQFLPLRLMNGVYLQLHAYMLRINVPYGAMCSRQIRQLAHIARTYDKGYGHFTTRQNIQFNWIQLKDVPDAQGDLAEVEMHCIQSSGNCIRNTTSDQYAGVAKDEIEDPRVYCEIIRQWSTLHPEFSYLPRKFKIAVTGSPNDRAAIALHDIGLRMHRNKNGEPGFEVLVGGGQGRTPFVAKTIRDWLPPEHLLSYLEAILRVYNMDGRRDNKWKARIKILVHQTGLEEFRRLVDTEWEQIRDSVLKLPQAEIDRINAYFAPPDYEKLDDAGEAVAAWRADNADFDAWVRVNVADHKTPGYAIVNISLKSPNQPPGDMTAAQMDAFANLADEYSFGELRVNHRQNLVLADVEQLRLWELWEKLRALDLATPNIGHVSDMIVCPGLDYCSLANARSIPIAQEINERFSDMDRAHDIGELTINISGCMNACGHHHVGHIGILGVDKRGKEFYQFTLGGSSDQAASLGDRTGPGFPADKAVDAVETILNTYIEIRKDGERFLDTYRRMGMAPFKEALYGTF
ncbi:MAG: sulfite reductase [Chromatiales bacterium]|jgi:sulfite reductase (NADPH) hemoprotein beta-component|nr:sulfite reductase [Chromatiales bacterium]MDP6150999.1 nitrite/sulfite reductase [Gammaproteobacteria bacterium]MDP7093635.1 nitrite/sulfite reductase [Gammaproteobacteria bacterium]MDP7271158.1 nitrite/sulfite reductase [Gammaproteobacteria bacterium]HJP04249.1 nitrite/sulfite reductase [Gammaproteobacteria bacterium]